MANLLTNHVWVLQDDSELSEEKMRLFIIQNNFSSLKLMVI
jgi:hypothetical protein